MLGKRWSSVHVTPVYLMDDYFPTSGHLYGDYGWLLKCDVLRIGPHKLEEIAGEEWPVSGEWK